MEMITKAELVELKNERWETVDQAMELALMIPEGDPVRAQLLTAAARVWIMSSSPLMVISSNVSPGETI